MYFWFFKLKKWDKKTAETRRRNCAVVPSFSSLPAFLKPITVLHGSGTSDPAACPPAFPREPYSTV